MELTGTKTNTGAKTYVVGDLHGHLAAGRFLLRELGFRFEVDHLWLVGDLVNRGPDSLGVLRWARQLQELLGERFVAVMGNHDTHLLALDDGVVGPSPKDADLMEILESEDRELLVSWLRTRPLLHRRGDHLLVHAGLHPDWTAGTAERRARNLEVALRSPEERKMLLARRPPADVAQKELWHSLEIFTRVRVLDAEGVPCSFKGPPAEAPPGCRPWFEIPGNRDPELKILFGHWAALGLHIGSGACCLDSGAAWGGPVTAMRLEDGHLFQSKEVSL